MDSLFGNDRIDGIVSKLHEVSGWPADVVKDRQLVSQLMEQYPSVDLATEITKWSAWMLDHESKGKKVRHRARFATWCCNAVKFSRERRTSTNGASSARRPGTYSGGAPSPRSQYAGSGYRDW